MASPCSLSQGRTLRARLSKDMINWPAAIGTQRTLLFPVVRQELRQPERQSAPAIKPAIDRSSSSSGQRIAQTLSTFKRVSLHYIASGVSAGHHNWTYVETGL